MAFQLLSRRNDLHRLSRPVPAVGKQNGNLSLLQCTCYSDLAGRRSLGLRIPSALFASPFCPSEPWIQPPLALSR